MRRTPSSLAMLLTLLGAASHAQEFDPVVLDCTGATIAALGLSAHLSSFVERPQIADAIDALSPDPETAYTALIVRLFEGPGCALNDEGNAAALGDLIEAELAPLQDVWRDLEAQEAVWNDLQPRLACLSMLTDAELERARQIIETNTGHACGLTE